LIGQVWIKMCAGRVSTFKGFTLIELVIAVAIVSLLASVAVPIAEVAVQRSKERELRSSLQQIREALDAYKDAVDEGHVFRKAGDSGYPPTLTDLADGVADAKNPNAARLYFLRRIPRDPLYPSLNVPAAQTWGLRSYASTHDDPAEGGDVFDVYSLSPGKGLNGIAYREW
jgi:general secretion pathway protein G